MTVSNSRGLLIGLLVLFCGSYAVNAQNRSNFDIRGTITNLNRSGSEAKTDKLPSSILVERRPNESGGHDKADVKITSETRIFAQDENGKREPLKVDALRLNQLVEVRFTPAPALLTYPIQAAAAEIKILSASPGASQNSANSLPNVAVQIPDSEIIKARRAINSGNAVWVEAWAKGDAAMLPGTFTADGKELVAGGKVYKGRKQILAMMRDSMQKRGGRAKLTVTTKDVWLDGDTAYETGTAVYEFTVDGRRQTLERRYFTVWKRQSKRGAWKIYSNTGIPRD